MPSFMSSHFKWYGRICKSSGLKILHSRLTLDYDEGIDKFSWNKLYLTYSIICLLVCTLLEISFFYQLWLSIFMHNSILSTTVNAFLYSVTAFKAALNASLPFIKSKSLQRFFKESSEYEERVHFVAPKTRREPTLTYYLIRPLLLVAFVANIGICSYLSFDLVDHLGFGGVLGVTLKIMLFAGNFLFYVYDTACFLVLRPCCEVIRSYIEHQHRVLHSIVRRGCIHNVGLEKGARLVEKVRLNLCTVSNLKRKLNDIWGHAIAVSGGMILCSICSTIYLNLIEEFWTLENLIAIWYAVLTSLNFLDITMLSDAMIEEVRNVERTLQNVATSSDNADYVKQVLYLKDSLKPGEMALSAAGFFKLTLPMLVSLAGAVITYTVILVQTSESVKKSRPNL